MLIKFYVLFCVSKKFCVLFDVMFINRFSFICFLFFVIVLFILFIVLCRRREVEDKVCLYFSAQCLPIFTGVLLCLKR